MAEDDASIAAELMTRELEAIPMWCVWNHFRINQTKTVALFVSRFRRKTNKPHSILLDGSPIEEVSENNYLGVTFDSSLSFKGHVKRTTAKAYGALKTLRHTQDSLPIVSRNLLYKALVLPHLEYCPSVWDSCTVESIDHQN